MPRRRAKYAHLALPAVLWVRGSSSNDRQKLRTYRTGPRYWLVDTNHFIDHAYQYSAATRRGLKIVSFDADFDRTTEGRLLFTDAL